MARKINKSLKIRKYALRHPNASYAQIAEACDAPVKYVYQVLYNARKATKATTPPRITKAEALAKARAAKKLHAEARAKMAKTLPVRGKGDEYEQKGGEWKVVAHYTSDKSIKSAEPDMVNHPPHYTTGGIETIDFIEAKKLGYNLGNVVKYITRADHKGDRLENLKKAQWYLNRELKHA
jgi:Protein of unknwon function (DUF3310)